MPRRRPRRHGPGGGGAPGLAIAGACDLEQFRVLMRAVALAKFSHFTEAEIARLHAYLTARAERVPE